MWSLNQPSADLRVRVGIVHSSSGTMALSERPLIDAVLMAIAQINQAGGVLGQVIEPVVADGRSNTAEFEHQAKKLIQAERVATVFGCWTSASRKVVKPILEEFNALLWYPVQYEGLESSPNIFYTGACPNQQVEPAVTWLAQNKGKKFYLIGSNYVFPRTVNKLIAAQLKQLGGQVVGEEYVDLGENNFTNIIARICQERPDVVFNTLNGDSNQYFYHQYREAGITASEIPILAVSVAEAELQRIGDVAIGHYASWSYFQSIDSPENNRFVDNFKANYGIHRVTSDPIEAAYSQVYLWKQAVEAAESFEVDRVRVAAYGQSFAAPGGLIKIEPNHHVQKYCRIGKILPNGQFEIVYSSERAIKPLPWMGAEELNFDKSELVISLLGEVSQGIQQNWLLDQKSRQLQQVETSLRESATQLRRHNLVLTKLAKSPALHQGDLKAAVKEITEASGENIGVERASVWLLDETKTKIKCLDLFEKSFWKHSEGFEIKALEYPGYFAALQQDEEIAAEDARTDPRTVEFAQSYLIPLGIVSMLDIPIRLKGQTAGVICLEHIGVMRHWTAEDQNFARSLADLVSLAVEATERKQAELALAEHQRILSTLIGNLPGIAYRGLNRPERTMLFISEGCYELTGYPTTAFTVEKTIAYNQLTHPEDRELLWDAVQTALKNHRPFQITYRIITATGQIKWVWEKGRGIFNSEGELLYLEGFITDISDRIQTEAALRQSEERWQLILQATGEGIYDWNITTREAFGSARLTEMLGYAEGEIVSNYDTWYDFLHPEDLDATVAALHAHIEGKTPQYIAQYRQRCKDGSYKWILARGQAQWDETGKPVRMVGSHQDISDRVSAESALRQKNDELTKALQQLKTAQEELIQAEKMAALGQLVAGIAHEINTPLGAIRSSVRTVDDFLAKTLETLPKFFQNISSEHQAYIFALIKSSSQETTFSTKEKRQFKRKLRQQLAQEEIANADFIADTLADLGVFDNLEQFLPLLKDPEGENVLQTAYELACVKGSTQIINTAVERASRVVFALKTYARYDRSGVMIQTQVTEGIEMVLTLYSNQLKQGVELIRNYAEIPGIFCYPDELNQVWTNLIHNAIQAMENRGILTIDVNQEDQQIKVSITDNGKGITHEVMPKIFEPFFTTKPPGEGSGMGLNIVKKIVEKHQGKIQVESEKGNTKFTVYLPIITES